MPSLDQLWMPIVLAAVLVFVMSALIHMVFKWHNSDYRGFSNEDEVREVIRKSNPGLGGYIVPYCKDQKDMARPEVIQKFTEGPIAVINLMKPGAPNMGKTLALWFVLTLLIALASGYLASRTVPVGAGFLAVARVVSITTFLAYAGGSVASMIWMGKAQSATMKEVFDAFLYGLVTAAAFGWLWPQS